MSVLVDPPLAERELVMTRLFNAPVALVFRLWTDPVHAMRWWGPRDYPITRLEMDLRPGGKWRACLTGTEDGRELWQGGVLRVLDPPRHLVFTFGWENRDDIDEETLIDIRFEAEGDKTRMHFRQTPFLSIEQRDGHRGGWSSCFDRLDDYIATEPLAR